MVSFRRFRFVVSGFSTCLISEIGTRFSITDLVRTTFILNRFSYFWFIVSMEILITLKKKQIQPNFNLFPKTGVISISSRVREGWAPIENARCGPEKKLLMLQTR